MSDSVIKLCGEQRRRWRQGEPVFVETYLAQRPSLEMNSDGLLDLIYNEIVLREENGEAPAVEEYVRRFPQFAIELRLQFNIHRAIEDAPKNVHDTSGTEGSHRSTVPSSLLVTGFEILAEIGRGGMGVVYRARQLSLKRLVALKVIRGGGDASPLEVSRFRTEAEAVARLQHPNIVQIFEIGEHAGEPYLALELVDGPSLDRLAQGQAFPARAAAQLIETVARALHHVHEQGVVHRDLKPGNILLAPRTAAKNPTSEIRNQKQMENPTLPRPEQDECLNSDIEFRLGDVSVSISDFTPKITDFGLAKLLNDDTSQSATKSPIGTPIYMAPEQATEDRTAIGPLADVYALGAILYELLTGQPPFQGQTVLEVLEQVRSAEPVRPSRLQLGVPRDLETICLKCLEKEPGRRYASAHELAEDLRRFLAHEPIRARPVGLFTHAVKWTKRRPTLAALIALTAATIVLLPLLDLRHRLAVESKAKEGRAEGRQEQEDHLRQAREAYTAFARHRGDALFHGIYRAPLPSGDASPSLEATRADVEKALAIVDMKIDTESPPVLNTEWSEREKAEVTAGCYQLFLILADATAYPVPKQSAEARQKQVREAIAILDRSAKLFPPTQAFYLRRARYLAQLGDEKSAKQELDHAAHVPPTSSIDYLLLGDEQFQRGEIQAAAQNFEKARLLEPNDFWCRYFLALCQLQLKHPKDAEANLTWCLEQRRDFLWARLLRGFAYGELEAFDAAEQDYRIALEANANDAGRYFVYVSRGLLRFRRKQFDVAVADLRDAIALKPKEFHARFTLAQLYMAQRRLDEATELFDQVLRLDPPGPVAAECHLLRGRVFLETNQNADALRNLNEYLAKGGKPGADFYRARGRAKMQLRDYLGAKDDYTRALEIEPDSELYAFRGWTYYFADAWKPALRDFDEALRVNSNNGDAYVGRGLARIMLGQCRDAVADAEEALSREPRKPEMMHNIACIFALAATEAEKPTADNELRASAPGYRRLAVDAVSQTLTLVPADERLTFWREKIVPDPALDSVRNTFEFKELEPTFPARGADDKK